VTTGRRTVSIDLQEAVFLVIDTLRREKMNQLIVQETLAPAFLRERRKSDRCGGEMNLLVITGRGTGKVLNIGKDGLSFGCLYPHTFPPIWSLDIIDANGTHLKKLMVRKVWEISSGHPELTENFELEIGVEFMELTPSQEIDLEVLLNNLIVRDVEPSCLL
jgi:hypothetical protein